MVAKEIQIKDGKSMPIREFHLDWFCQNPSICMIAKRGGGKSWICRCLIDHFKNLPGGVIIAPTDKMTNFFGKFFPDIYIHYKYDTDLLQRVLDRQEMIIEKCKQKYYEGKRVDPRAFLIMDDCLASKGTWMNDKPILEIFFNGRHYQLVFILTMQFPLGIKPELRCNFDYIFLLAEDFYSNQKRLYDHYAGMFPTFDFFRQVFLQITDDFGAMVIVNRGVRKDILDKVFYFKAENKKITQIGCKQFQEFHNNNYNKNYQSDSKTNNKFDINKFEQKKNKPRVVVNKV